jgi:hypothetical protein
MPLCENLDMQDAPDLSDRATVRSYLIAQRAVNRARQRYPWYDCNWLRKYSAAKELVAHLRPERLSSFVEALEPLRTRGNFSTQELRSTFDATRLREIRDVVRGVADDKLKSHEAEQFGRMIVHDLPKFVALQQQLEQLIGEIVGEPVESSYNFLSLYSRFGVCEPHMDSPIAKWTFDLCIEQSRVWSLFLSQVVDWPETFAATSDNWQRDIVDDPRLTFTEFNLEPGDAVVFSGSSQWHYREPLPLPRPNDFCNLLFFHFLPRGMREMASAANWPRLFEMEELEWIVSAKALAPAWKPT